MTGKGTKPCLTPMLADEPEDSGEEDVVSVAILTYNGGELFQRCLERVFAQKIAEEIEVVLVDSGSSDGTAELDQQFPVKIISIPADRFNYGFARNKAFASSRGRFIATISQDFIPADEHWLENLIRPLRSGAHIAQGTGKLPPGRRPFYWETRRFWFTGESREFARRHGGVSISCVNLATQRKIWLETGFGDDTPMSEDKFFQKRAFEKGYTRVVVVPEATGFHGHQYDLKSLFRRCENEGLGARWVGVQYTLPALLLDLLRPASYAKLFLGLVSGRIRSWAELLFIWVRPIAVYKGNRFGRAWKR